MKFSKAILLCILISIVSCSSEDSDIESKEDVNENACVFEPYKGSIKEIELYNEAVRIEIRSFIHSIYLGNIDSEEQDSIPKVSRVDPKDNYAEQIFLNEFQKDSLFKLLKGFKKETEYTGAECYNPRHLVLFYNDKGLMIDYLEICFECNKVRESLVDFELICNDQLDYYRNFFKWCGIKKFYRE